ncbi:MAG: efflux transporter outer membrane subunit [Nitrosomonadales bacterium]|nr:efflux transporter outer membrane subunit [Nitrosomonadales bacterium]
MLSGCAAGPDFKRPVAPSASSYAPANNTAEPTASAPVPVGESQRFNPAADIPYDWWTLFRSPQLNALIEHTLKASPTIEAAQAALRQAHENVVTQQGFFYPTVGVSYAPSRNMLAGNMGGNSPGIQGNGSAIQTYSNPAGPDYNGPAYYNWHTAQLSVGYVPDVFGINRRLAESALAQEQWQQMQLQATYITLISNVIAAAFQEAGLRAQIAAINNIISINRENLEIMHRQLERGYLAEIDVAAQEALLAQSEQALPPLNKQLEQTRDLIRALAGNLPDQEVPEFFTLADFHLPEELPLSLPSTLVEQRPDVRAAEAQLHSASAQYGVTVANKMPQFMVTANVGGMASSPDWMFRSGGSFFNLTGNISQIIFDGGTLRAKSRAAEQALIQAAAQYRGTVITALQNVADTLHAIRTDADALKAAAKSERASKTVLELSGKQYQLGYISYQNLLAAQQSYQLAVIGLAQAQSSRLGDTAALYQSLGGGWWNRPEMTATQDTASPIVQPHTLAPGDSAK